MMIEISTTDYPHLGQYGTCAYECPFHAYGEPCGYFCTLKCEEFKQFKDERCMVPGPKCPGPGTYHLVREEDALAKVFHEAYERLAPEFGYETRVFDPNTVNGKLMLAEVRKHLGLEK